MSMKPGNTDNHARKAGNRAAIKISGGAGKKLTFLTRHNEMAGEPLFMRVSGPSENLTFP